MDREPFSPGHRRYTIRVIVERRAQATIHIGGRGEILNFYNNGGSKYSGRVFTDLDIDRYFLPLRESMAVQLGRKILTSLPTDFKRSK